MRQIKALYLSAFASCIPACIHTQTCHSFTVHSVFVLEMKEVRVIASVQVSLASLSLSLSVATHIKRGSLSLCSLFVISS